MRIPVVTIVALLAATPAQAQWGKPLPSGNAADARIAEVPGGHLVTISAPYQFASLDPNVTKIGITCQIGFVLRRVGGATTQAFAQHETDITPVGGAASGTAVVTWDQADLDPTTDLTTIRGDSCWLVFYVQGKGALSFHVDHTAGPGMRSQAGASGEPAVQYQPGSGPATQVPFSFSP